MVTFNPQDKELVLFAYYDATAGGRLGFGEHEQRTERALKAAVDTWEFLIRANNDHLSPRQRKELEKAGELPEVAMPESTEVQRALTCIQEFITYRRRAVDGDCRRAARVAQEQKKNVFNNARKPVPIG